MDIYKKTLEDLSLQSADYYDFHSGIIYHTALWYGKYESGDTDAHMLCTFPDGSTRIVKR